MKRFLTPLVLACVSCLFVFAVSSTVTAGSKTACRAKCVEEGNECRASTFKACGVPVDCGFENIDTPRCKKARQSKYGCLEPRLQKCTVDYSSCLERCDWLKLRQR